nr:hypothetical protein [Tanacetum cinerariifolium]
MSTQQDIYAADSENRPLMLNKDNYVLWSSRLLYYAKIKPNGKLIYNSIMHDPYVRRMNPEPGDPYREVYVVETFHEYTDEELTEKEVKQIEADDQDIQTILMGLSEDIYDGSRIEDRARHSRPTNPLMYGPKTRRQTQPTGIALFQRRPSTNARPRPQRLNNIPRLTLGRIHKDHIPTAAASDFPTRKTRDLAKQSKDYCMGNRKENVNVLNTDNKQ